MLIVERRVGETICVGETIRLTVMEADDGRGVARVGIECPREVPVYRGDRPHADGPKPAAGEGAGR